MIDKENALFETLIELGIEEMIKYEGKKHVDEDNNERFNEEDEDKDRDTRVYQCKLVLN